MAEFSWLTALGFVFLTFNSGMAVYRSNGDAGSVIFVAVSYLDLVALFACLRLYERLDRHSPRRERIKAAVWALTTLLTVMFTYKVAEVMPLAVKLLWELGKGHWNILSAVMGDTYKGIDTRKFTKQWMFK
uniref:Uncharacterized protein n=1 Tax=Aegilops tauschii TaxID=37682 RepID=M8C664_AEGTA